MKLIENQNLSEIFWYKIGGIARYLVEISTREDFYEAMDFIRDRKISNILVVGDGTNCIFSDDFFDGIVLRFTPSANGITLEEDFIRVWAGQSLDEVIQFGFQNKLVGLEWAGGLPGSVGAAIRGNVGAFGGEIKNIFVKAFCVKVHENGEFEDIVLQCDQMEFAYRTSRVKKEKLVVLEVFLRLKKAETEEEIFDAKEIYEKNINYRKINHPLEYPNCGSVFKNISQKDEIEKILRVWPEVRGLVEEKWHGKASMGYIIGRLGLAGKKTGGAQISEKHHNFIVNKNNATSHDVKTLIADVQKTLQETFGFTPEVEVEIIF